MILWTVMPIDMVFASSAPPPQYQEIVYAGTNVLVEKISPTQCRIVRLLTTNPADYLRPEIQPGVILNFEPSAK